MNTKNINSDTELTFTEQLSELGSRGKLHIEKLLAAAPNNSFTLAERNKDGDFDSDIFDLPAAMLKERDGEYSPSNITQVILHNNIITVFGSGEYAENTNGTIDDLSDEQICFLADHLESLTHEKDTDI